MVDRQTFKNQDLVLKVSLSIDPTKFDINKYEAFIDALCGNREYQKEAIRVTLRYLLGGRYKTVKDLAKENYKENPVLEERYGSLDGLIKHLQLSDKLSCTIDLATATGKSYVFYAIARIMLAEGAVDQVLVLCPSNTIETGLTEKFRALSANKTLKDLLPESSEILNPRIINATQTIRKGDICIENIHATYQRTKSAIEDSLVGKGATTLVINDEVHHMANPPGRDIAFKKWKEFLKDEKYNFRYIVGDSGTCYVANDYFADVICRFSLSDAIEQKFSKTIDYVAEDISHTKDEKFQKIYDNHIANKFTYRLIKPLTILVTKNISACERLTEDLTEFLAKREKISKEAAMGKVLIVTSSSKHKNNISKLRNVDDKNSLIEWITSVSMLSEGWDVQNVFQIVPHEERAFNSRLLIAQVLGRGLRIPPEYRGEQPVVTVFNHDKWSSAIRHLVNEVLEIERRISSYVVPKEEDYNFNLHDIDYKKSEKLVETPQLKEYDFSKGYITLSSQKRALERETVYERAITEKRRGKKTLIEYEMYSAKDAAQDVANKLIIYDMEAGTNYATKYPYKKILKFVRNSLAKIGVKEAVLSEENRQKILQAYGVIRRKGSKSLRYEIEAENLYTINTSEVKKTSMGVGALRSDSSIFYDDYSLKEGDEEDINLLQELLADETLPRYSLQGVKNVFNFKTPLNVVFAASKPERDFIKRLVAQNNAKVIKAWIKSPDVGFYSIEYSWRKGEHPKRERFNPDFFIKIDSDIIVVEVKDDRAMDEERADFKQNQGKLKYAVQHFERVNRLQKEQRYYFKFLSPISYDLFFQTLRERKYKEFTSELQAKLEG